MKRFFLLCVPLLLLAVQARAYDFEADDANGNRLFYSVSDADNHYVKIVSELGGESSYSGDIIIPETVKDDDGTEYTVNEIDDSAFSNASSLTSVNIPSSVTAISDETFYKCTNLATVTFGEGSALTRIGSYAFYDCTSLTSMNIPDGVTSIGGYAFYDCTSLMSINIPSGVTAINNYTFWACSSLPSVTLPENLTSIGSYAFCQCSALTSINIPDGVTAISKQAFWNCSSLLSVTLPENLTSIDQYAFANCSSLTEITIPEKVTSIGNYAFQSCTSLTTLNFNAAECEDFGHSTSSSTHYEPFYSCTAIETVTIGANVKQIPAYFLYGANTKTVTIADNSSLTSIGTYAFYNCSALESSITIPDGVTAINNYTFYGCSSLPSVTLPENLTSIGVHAFRGCSALTSINIPSGVTTIGTYAFYNCSSLTEIIIPDGVTSISDYTFYGCSSLPSITLPDNLTSIGSYAFYKCSLLTEITIPEGVTSIGNYAFQSCTSLTTLNFNATECADFSSTNKYQPFYGCSKLATLNFGASVKQIPAYFLYGISSLKTLTIADDSQLTSIGTYAFYNCSALESSITIPDGVTAINNYTFYSCSSLPSVTLPENLTSIGTYAFSNCSSLAEINIPSGVSSIGADAFYNCTSPTEITIPEGVSSIGTAAFSSCTSLTTLNFNATECADFGGSSPFQSCSSLATVNIGANVKQIPAYFLYGITSLTTVVIPDGTEEGTEKSALTSIGTGAFYNCYALESLCTIPATCETIGESALYNVPLTALCFEEGAVYSTDGYALYNGDKTELIVYYAKNTLTEYTIPASVVTIDDTAFEGNTYLKTLLFENESKLDTIGANAFNGCTALTGITVPASCKVISNYVFYGCTKLATVTFEEESQLDSIGTYAFYECSALTEITIPAGVTTIGDRAFYQCSSLATVTFSDDSKLTTIGPLAFYNCSALTEITIPEKVTSVGENAFENCTSLATVNFNAAECEDFSSTSSFQPFYGCTTLATANIGANVKQIPAYFLRGISSLTTLTIADNSALTSIGNYAFYGSALTSITLPDKLTSIGSYAFASCKSLTEITIPENVTTIGAEAFYACSALTTLNFNATECADFGGISQFQSCSSLVTVNIGANVKQIPAYFLYGITSLTTVVIPDGTEEGTEKSVLTSIGKYAFYNCSSIEYFCTIPATCETIGEEALYNVPLTGMCFEEGSSYCTDGYALFNSDKTELIIYYAENTIEAYEIPASVTSIDENAFYDCTNLKTVTFESGSEIKTIDNHAFYWCTSLTEITIPASVETIDTYAFYWCTSLATVTFEENSALTTIGSYAFYNCSVLTEITIPGGVTSIGNYAFQKCTSLATVHFNATACADFNSTEKYEPFYGCTALTTVTIGANVTAIPAYFLYDITSLETLTIADDSQMTGIGTYAFYGCTSLAAVTFGDNSALTSIGDRAFYHCSSLATVTFGENSELTSIGYYTFNGCSALTSITLPDKLTTIGFGSFYGCSSLTEVNIPEKVTSIGNQAFYNCTSLATLHFNAAECGNFYSNSLNYSFSGCTALKTATIGAKVTILPQYLFFYLSGLVTVTVDEGSVLETIDKYAFDNCTSLKEVTIPSGVTSIGSEAFYNCTSLTTLNFNAVNCTTMGTQAESAVYGCAALSTVNIADNVEYLPSYFLIGTRNDYFPNLTSITIPDGVTSIGSYALYDVNLLDSLTIGANVTSIGENAFTHCTNLKTIICNAQNPPSCGTQAFYQIADDAWLVVPEGYSQNYTDENTVQALAATKTGWSDIAHMREATVSFPMRTTEGYATHYSPYEYTLADNLEATTIVDADSDGKLTMYWEYGHGTYTDADGCEQEQSPIVPAGVAVLLHEVEPNNQENHSNIENDGTQSYAEYSNTTINWDEDVTPTNMLYGSKEATTTTVGEDGDDEDYYFYKFAYSYKRYTDDDGNVTHSDDGVLGFYWGNSETGGPFSIGANYAWLAIPQTIVDGEDDGETEAKLNGYPLVDGDGNDLYGNDGQTTQIDGVDTDDAANSGAEIIYNMAGQRVNDMNRRGVYIVNGRKVAVK